MATYLTVDRALASGLNKIVLSSQFRYSKMLRGGESADIIVLGNSRGVNGFYAPNLEAMTGKKVLNLSYNGLSMEGSLLMYKSYLKNNKPPKYLLIEITSMQLEGAPRELLQLYSLSTSNFESEWSKINSREAMLARTLSNTFYFNNEMFLRSLSYLRKSDQSWINRYTITEDFARNFQPTEWMQSEWNSVKASQINSLLAMILMAERSNCEVFLCVTPYLPNYINKIRNYRTWLQSVRDSLPKGYVVVDLSDAVTDNKFFADPLHMNIHGFKAFGNILKTRLPDSLISDTVEDRNSTNAK